MSEHRSLQRRVRWIVATVVLIAILVTVPLAIDNELRLELAVKSGLAPGKDAVQLADGDDGALLIVVPLDNAGGESSSPWLYQAQFIAWPNADGVLLQNLETDAELQIPLERVEFSAANADGSLVLLRGPEMGKGAEAAITVSTQSMELTRLSTPESIPDANGDWQTPTWEKTLGTCDRPSPQKHLVGCFNRASTASYLAGDWQLDLQAWGDFDNVEPVMRGMGFLPWVGFAKNDTVVYLQNENGIWRIDVPDTMLKYDTPVLHSYLAVWKNEPGSKETESSYGGLIRTAPVQRMAFWPIPR